MGDGINGYGKQRIAEKNQGITERITILVNFWKDGRRWRTILNSPADPRRLGNFQPFTAEFWSPPSQRLITSLQQAALVSQFGILTILMIGDPDHRQKW